MRNLKQGKRRKRWCWRVSFFGAAILWCVVYWYLVELTNRAQVPYCGSSMAHDRCLHLVKTKRWEWKQKLFQTIQGEIKWTVKKGKLKRGIVMTGGPREEENLWRNIEQLRHRLKCSLPLEIWHSKPLQPGFCTKVMETHGAVVCRDLTEGGVRSILSVAHARMFAIALSSFQQVLYVDADCFALQDPAPLFESWPFLKYGAVFWRGAHDSESLLSGSTTKPNHVMWQVIDRPYNQSNPLHTRERGSGIMLVDKTKCREALELASIFVQDTTFYPQVVGANGRELFRFAWLALDQPFYFTHTPVSFLDVGSSPMYGLFCPKSIVLYAGSSLLSIGSPVDPKANRKLHRAGRPLFIHKSPHYAGSSSVQVSPGESYTLFSCSEHACNHRFQCFLALPYPLSALSYVFPFVLPQSHLTTITL